MSQAAMHPKYLLIVTAVSEAATGLALLALPGVVLWLLLGLRSVTVATDLVARVAGAALVAFGVACWSARDIEGRAARRGMLAAALIYDVTAAALLAYAGLGWDMVGLALWPGVALHAVLAAWCVICLVFPQLWSTP
jgi:hypothetical protein